MQLLFGNRSAAYFFLGNFEQALRDALRAIEIDPAWVKVGFVLFSIGCLGFLLVCVFAPSNRVIATVCFALGRATCVLPKLTLSQSNLIMQSRSCRWHYDLRCVTAGYLSFGPIEKYCVFCELSVREEDWRSRARGAKATLALSTACSARHAS